jgi:hypothetical protein
LSTLRRAQSRGRPARDSADFSDPSCQGDELRAAVGAHADHHQQAWLVLFEADIHVDPGRLQEQVIDAGQVPGGERALHRERVR